MQMLLTSLDDSRLGPTCPQSPTRPARAFPGRTAVVYLCTVMTRQRGAEGLRRGAAVREMIRPSQLAGSGTRIWPLTGGCLGRGPVGPAPNRGRRICPKASRLAGVAPKVSD